MSQHSRPFGDLHKVRGPGHLRCADGKARQGQRRQLGWGEGAKARDGRARNRHRQRGLVGAKGLKPRRQGQGIQAVSGLWTRPKLARGQRAWREGVRPAKPGPRASSGHVPTAQQTGVRGPWFQPPRGGLQCRTAMLIRVTGKGKARANGQPGPGPGPGQGQGQGQGQASKADGGEGTQGAHPEGLQCRTQQCMRTVWGLG